MKDWKYLCSVLALFGFGTALQSRSRGRGAALNLKMLYLATLALRSLVQSAFRPKKC